MERYRLHILDLPQVLDNAVHRNVIIGSKKDTYCLQSFIYNIDVENWTQEILSEKMFALWGLRKVVKQTIDGETFFRSRRSFGRPMAMGIWT